MEVFFGIERKFSERDAPRRFTAREELEEGVKVLMSEKKLDYIEALKEVTRKNPEMWTRYKMEVMGNA